MKQDIRIITISRQFGAGGHSFAMELSRRLAVPLFNREPLSALAREMKTSEEILNKYESMKYDPDRFVLSSFAKRYSFLEKDIIESKKYISSLKKVILELVSIGKVILMGRGGQCILHDHPGCLHLRIVADFDDRLARLSRLEDYSSLPKKQLEQMVRKVDGYRAKFISRHFGRDIADPVLYHLTINFSLLPMEEALNMVIGLCLNSR